MYSPEVGRLLARELGRVGGFGAGLVARLLPANVGTAEVTLPLDPAAAAELVRRVLAAVGSPAAFDSADLAGSACAVVGCGYLRMNPAVVCVQVRRGAGGGSEVAVVGVAKEGLVKQRGGEQTAREVADLIRGAARGQEA